MKLILAIVNNDDSAIAAASLTEAGFFVTKLSTTGGFLMVGNTTLLIGTEEKDVEVVLDLLKKYCTTRKQMNTPTSSFGAGLQNFSLPEEVTVSGATVFVLGVDRMEKL